jgi:NitT/TauT family transport system substrate-binding protein
MMITLTRTNLTLLGLLIAGTVILAQNPAASNELRVFGAMTTVELSPVLVAANGIYPGPVSVSNGGVTNLTNGTADVATNAETQLLRQSVDDPDLRIILTVTENFYRIVARKSAGIQKVSDLKGKKITVPRNTSAEYFLYKMLATAKLTEDDVTIVPITPVSEMAAALKDGRVDAVAMWDPETARAALAVGDDAVVLQDKTVYRELFNLNTSAKVIANPAKRRAIVEFLRSIRTATQRLETKPRDLWPYISSKLNHSIELLEKSWPQLRFTKGIATDVLNVLEEEERWVARERSRSPRTRAQLAILIDKSLLDEAGN